MFLEILSHLMWGQDWKNSVQKCLFEESGPRQYLTYG